MNTLSKLVFSLISLATFSVNATLMDHGNYLTDIQSGLDWRDLTDSVNRSFTDVSSQLGTGGDFEGWRYASTAELWQLIFNVSGVSITQHNVIYSFADGPIDSLLDLLGETATGTSIDTPIDRESQGMTSDVTGVPGGPFYYVSRLYDPPEIITPASDTVITNYYGIRNDTATEYVGSFLVRTSTTVPSPSSLLLLILGLAGLAIQRKQKFMQASLVIRRESFSMLLCLLYALRPLKSFCVLNRILFNMSKLKITTMFIWLLIKENYYGSG